MAGGAQDGATRRVKVWDPWVRAMHWAIVLLIPFSWWTAETGRFDLHFLSGYAILTLVLFRLAWGLVGSQTARFGSFLKSPAAAIAHFGQMRRDDPHVDIGHNAAGGWMVILLLLLLLAQTGTGLFADDAIFSRGPLARRVEEATSALATSIHLRVFWVIVGCAVLHILAVVAYRVLFGRNLVKAMVTGSLDLPPCQADKAPRMGNPVLAVALLAAAGAFVWWITTLRPASMF